MSVRDDRQTDWRQQFTFAKNDMPPGARVCSYAPLLSDRIFFGILFNP